MTHLPFETLSDLVDDRVPAGERGAVDAHLADCAGCRATLAALRETIDDAAVLSRDVPAPEGLWEDIQLSIEAGKVTPIPVAAPAPLRGWWMTPRRVAATAVMLVAASSGLTAVVMQRTEAHPVTASVPDRVEPSGAAVVLPVQWQVAERGYLNSVAELRSQLDAQRDHLSPATIRTVEHSLQQIDIAIAEARVALSMDPGSAALSELLASNYRQKVDLLRRATQLGPST